MADNSRRTNAQPNEYRFGPEISARIGEVENAYESAIQPDISDSIELADEKESKRKALYNYRGGINPSYYSKKVKQEKYYKSRNLTIGMLDSFLYTMGWTRRQFYELCLDENAGFTPEECLNFERNDGWTRLDWPDASMARMAAVLDRCSMSSKRLIESYIKACLPKSYPRLVETLNESSMELGTDEDSKPAYLNDIKDYTPETKGENMGNRIYESVKYKVVDEDRRFRIFRENNITYSSAFPSRAMLPRHYWLFKLNEVKRICSAFGLTPHWVIFGADGKAFLAGDEETERIMDIFQFVPEQDRYVLATAAEKALAEGLIGKEVNHES